MDNLDIWQRAASSTGSRYSLVLAGAGAGKTSTLIARVIMLINSGVEPGRILIVTFSRKACTELRERLSTRLKTGSESVFISTFHGLALGILRDYGNEFRDLSGYNSFPDVMSGAEKEALMHKIFRENMKAWKGMPYDIASKAVCGMLSKRTVSREEMAKSGMSAVIERFQQRFRQLKRESSLIDYDDIIFFANSLLSQNVRVREQVQSKFSYVLVDEFQDTSPDNYELICNIINGNRDCGLFLIGDDWQSIYGFRKAEVDYIVNPGKYFPGISIYRLERNYRSHREIVEISSRLIRKNRYRTRKKAISIPGPGGLVRMYVVSGPADEFVYVSKLIENIPETETLLVEYRNNRYGKEIRDRIGEGAEKKNVFFMTMHSSKGLEFDNVVIAGLADGILPDSSSGIEEERRLLYVAMTRSKKRLIILATPGTDGRLPLFCRGLGIRALKWDESCL